MLLLATTLLSKWFCAKQLNRLDPGTLRLYLLRMGRGGVSMMIFSEIAGSGLRLELLHHTQRRSSPKAIANNSFTFMWTNAPAVGQILAALCVFFITLL